jgi:outer membrane protein OmpA-like peptidoglycan-associated protein
MPVISNARTFGRLAPVAITALALAAPARAITIEFPAPATVTQSLQTPLGSTSVATGPWANGTIPTRSLQGSIDQTAYRIGEPGLQTLQILDPIRDQLLADGYTPIYDCKDTACGGFDFRFGLTIFPEPAMHVDMGDYRYFAAERSTPAGDEVISLIVSRASNAGFVQVTRVGGALPPADVRLSTMAPPLAPVAAPLTSPDTAPIAPATTPPIPSELGQRLETGGAVALDDLVFPSGAAVLAEGDYASLSALAAYLATNPARQVAIVGHTDASGGLDANIALSRRRAESVRRTLIDRYGAKGAQVQAEGVGYLSPRASNLTATGRAANRRVEVMLTSTE